MWKVPILLYLCACREGTHTIAGNIVLREVGGSREEARLARHVLRDKLLHGLPSSRGNSCEFATLYRRRRRRRSV